MPSTGKMASVQFGKRRVVRLWDMWRKGQRHKRVSAFAKRNASPSAEAAEYACCKKLEIAAVVRLPERSFCW